jgi:O-antigen/teichoic acid export membrane protein
VSSRCESGNPTNCGRRAAQLIAKSRDTALARNSVWMFLAYGSRVVIQAGYFVLIARTLGAREYGAFVTATALVSIVSPFASLGAGDLLVKHVSRDRREFPVCWGNGILVTVVSGVAILALLSVIGLFVLPKSVPWSLILLVSIADLFGMRLVDLAAEAFQAFEKLQHTAQITLLPSVLRLLGAAYVFFAWHRTTAWMWSCIYLSSTCFSAAAAIFLTTRRLGHPRLQVGRIRNDLKEGFYFSISLSAQTIYNDIDKTMLARLSTLEATGIYAAAYRLIDVAFTPVRSVLNAAYPNFFRRGQGGIESSYSYGKRLLLRTAGYSAIVFFGLMVAAPIVPLVLGREYRLTTEALRWLALLPLLKTIHYFLADSLTGAGYQALRSGAQVVVATGNILLNFWLIPVYSWRGAAWASIASDATLAVALYILIRILHRNPSARITVSAGVSEQYEHGA